SQSLCPSYQGFHIIVKRFRVFGADVKRRVALAFSSAWRARVAAGHVSRRVSVARGALRRVALAQRFSVACVASSVSRRRGVGPASLAFGVGGVAWLVASRGVALALAWHRGVVAWRGGAALALVWLSVFVG
ncbi:hypothetical protein ACXZ9C_10470, partial [Streptococcus agalactiae]